MTIDAWEAELVRIDAAVAQARASGGSARAAVRLRSLHLKIKPGQEQERWKSYQQQEQLLQEQQVQPEQREQLTELRGGGCRGSSCNGRNKTTTGRVLRLASPMRLLALCSIMGTHLRLMDALMFMRQMQETVGLLR